MASTHVNGNHACKDNMDVNANHACEWKTGLWFNKTNFNEEECKTWMQMADMHVNGEHACA